MTGRVSWIDSTNPRRVEILGEDGKTYHLDVATCEMPFASLRLNDPVVFMLSERAYWVKRSQ